MGLNEKLKEVADLLKASREYSEMKQAKARIDSSRELKSKVDDFKRQQQEVFSGKLSQKELEAKASQLNTIFLSLSKIPEIDKFLKAEKAFGDLLQRCFKEISEYLKS